MRTKARIRFRRLERVQRQANRRIYHSLTGDQRRVLTFSQQGYAPAEIARELALPTEYVIHFMIGMTQRLSSEGLIPSPDWRHVLEWAKEKEKSLNGRENQRRAQM